MMIFATSLVSSLSFAGNGGGTMTLAAGDELGAGSLLQLFGGSGSEVALYTNPEIIFHMEQKDGFVKFAYGKLVDKQWQIQNIYSPASELSFTREEISALETSKITKDWVYIK